MNKVHIITYLKQHKKIMNIIAFIYSFIHGSNVWKYLFNKNVTFKGAFLNHTKIYINQYSNIYIGAKCQLNNCIIDARGEANNFVWRANMH